MKNNKNRVKYNLKKGFTLVEVMTVVALIAVLFVIFVPRIDFANNKVRESGLQSDFRSYQLAFEQVARESSGFTKFESEANPEDALVKAMNSYLDKKLKFKVAVAEDLDAEKHPNWVSGGIIVKNIQDPWKTDYLFVWDKTADAVYVVSPGPDKKAFGDEAAELILDVDAAEGTDAAVNNDNYSIGVKYAVSGLSTDSTGFANNIESVPDDEVTPEN